MLLEILKSKVHKATVTQTELDYVGSITIDEDIMDAAQLFYFELVHVWNITNGSRLTTYVIPGERGSKIFCLNGAAAHLNRVGDKIIVASFARMTPEEAKGFRPKIVLISKENKIDKIID